MGQTQSAGHNVQDVIQKIDQVIKKEFEANQRLLQFQEYAALLTDKPHQQLRGTAQYVLDMLDHFGRRLIDHAEAKGVTHSERFKLFDCPVDGIVPKVAGQEIVQYRLYQSLKTFSRQRINNKLLLLHGPNGSAKSSISHALMGGLERYSEMPEGAQYTFNWIFPVERYTKGGIGMNVYSEKEKRQESFARLSDEDISARISCDLKDHPLLIIPRPHRKEFLEKLLGKEKTDSLWEKMPNYLTEGNLCHRCQEILNALLVANAGNYLKVLMHVQVERMYYSRRYRRGLVTIEPQLHVDAQYHQLTYNKSVASLPASLQNLNLFTLTGDLIDGNRGIVEFSDLLKRPVDTFKYLLGACETGAVNVGNSIAYLDTLMIGSTNEIQLDAFKEFPDFTSFKARIELIRVPYLLSLSEEQEIYEAQLLQVAGEKHVTPHVAWAAALWAVLSRMKKPNGINYPPNLSSIVTTLTPFEKVKLLDRGEIPQMLSPEDRKLLRANIRKIREEYENVPYYEGRVGASAREIKSLLYDAAQNSEYPCLSPLTVLRQMEEFIKRTSEYEFLKQEVKDGYHDMAEFISTVRNEYLNRIDREVRDSMGIYESKQWEDFIRKYVQHVSMILKKEKVKNPITGKLEDPDTALIHEFEKIVGAPSEGAEVEAFRQNVISTIGAWALDHPREPVVYSKVLPEFWNKLEKHYFESQKDLLNKVHTALQLKDTDQEDTTSEGGKLAQLTVNNMVSRLGYCRKCAKEVITFLMKQRY